MSKANADILEKLKAPFPQPDIGWRVQKSGIKNGKPWAMVLAYVSSRAIQDRLDDTVGPENWRFTIRPVDSLWTEQQLAKAIEKHEKSKKAPEEKAGFMGRLEVKIDDEWVWREDGAPLTDFESFKGGISNALKRVAVHYGIGRYLYRLKAGWANFQEGGQFRDKIDGEYYDWNPPDLPDWALPDNEKKKGHKEVEQETEEARGAVSKSAEQTVEKDTGSDYDRHILEKLEAEIAEIDVLTHLSRWWTKHQPEFKQLTPEYKTKLTIAKDKRKMEIRDKLKLDKQAELAGMSGDK